MVADSNERFQRISYQVRLSNRPELADKFLRADEGTEEIMTESQSQLLQVRLTPNEPETLNHHRLLTVDIAALEDSCRWSSLARLRSTTVFPDEGHME